MNFTKIRVLSVLSRKGRYTAGFKHGFIKKTRIYDKPRVGLKQGEITRILVKNRVINTDFREISIFVDTTVTTTVPIPLRPLKSMKMGPGRWSRATTRVRTVSPTPPITRAPTPPPPPSACPAGTVPSCCLEVVPCSPGFFWFQHS